MRVENRDPNGRNGGENGGENGGGDVGGDAPDLPERIISSTGGKAGLYIFLVVIATLFAIVVFR